MSKLDTKNFEYFKVQKSNYDSPEPLLMHPLLSGDFKFIKIDVLVENFICLNNHITL